MGYVGRGAGASAFGGYILLIKRGLPASWSPVGFTALDSMTNGLTRYKATIQNSVGPDGQYADIVRLHVSGNFPAVGSGYQDIYWMDVQINQGAELGPLGSQAQVRASSRTLFYDGMVSGEALRPAEYGSNVTEARTAAAISGQSALATAPFGLNPAGAIDAVNIDNYGVGRLSGFWPQEAGSNRTESRTAAGIAGQGVYATAPRIGRNEWNSYFYTNAISLDYTITRSDGVNTVTENLVVTSWGIAAGISGQGRGATSNNLYDLDPGAAGQLANRSSVQTIRIGFGQSALITKALAPNAACEINAFFAAHSIGSGGSNIRVDAVWRVAGASSWNTFTGDTTTITPDEPGSCSASGTFQNGAGVTTVFEIAAIGYASNQGNVQVTPSQCYLTA